MRAKFIFEDVVSFYATGCEVAVGQRFDVDLSDVPGAIEWQATNDAVLDISVNSTGSHATIIALTPGMSKIELEYRDHDYGPLRITVFGVGAGQLKPSIGTPEQQ